MFKMLEGELAPMFEIRLVKIETDQEHQARFNARAKELQKQMKDKYLCHPSNQVQRKDGRHFGAVPANVRPIKRKEAA